MNLERYANQLAEQFDDHLDRYRERGHEMDCGYAAAYRLALSLLHAHTNGQFGTPMDELSCPHDVKPKLPA